MNELIWAQVAATLISSAVTFTAGTMLYVLRSKQKEQQGKATEQEKKLHLMEMGIQSLLRDKILERCQTALRIGSTSIRDKENITRMYSAYHDLGGNDIVTSVYEQFMELTTSE